MVYFEWCADCPARRDIHLRIVLARSTCSAEMEPTAVMNDWKGYVAGLVYLAAMIFGGYELLRWGNREFPELLSWALPAVAAVWFFSVFAIKGAIESIAQSAQQWLAPQAASMPSDLKMMTRLDLISEHLSAESARSDIGIQLARLNVESRSRFEDLYPDLMLVDLVAADESGSVAELSQVDARFKPLKVILVKGRAASAVSPSAGILDSSTHATTWFPAPWGRIDRSERLAIQ